MISSTDLHPAFPHTAEMGDGSKLHYAGMTLRDYFAAQVLPAIAKHSIGMDTEVLRKNIEAYSCYSVEQFVSKIAYMYADEMLEARKQ